MKLIVSMDAVPQSRPRFYRGKAYDAPQCKEFKQQLTKAVKELYGAPILEGEMKLELAIYRASTKFKTRGVANRRYGDADNLAKGILDALNGVVWKDDCQIAELTISKHLAETPRIEISIDDLKSENQRRLDAFLKKLPAFGIKLNKK